VATGAFSAIVPLFEDSAPTAAADEGHYDAMLAADSTALDSDAPAVSMVPVELAAETVSVEDHVARVVQAAELAELHAEQARQQAERERISDLIESGGLDGWIAEALQVMGMPQSLAPGIKKIILAESGGNPHAVNTWDSNAVRGTPSRGLMQTIPSTFRAYVHPEMAGRPITDPVANITAGVRYMVDRYGMKTVVAGGRSDGAGGYLGY
jgi:soluble lytic murein transglycosylase-like protein